LRDDACELTLLPDETRYQPMATSLFSAIAASSNQSIERDVLPHATHLSR